ncbi:hypothetical protein BJ322DRAFT_1105684 [Thelephora terrestris]|uniref:Uncharacterized protein n=1 Tax=Thelephora terrestris TaxID=56493 RepID=A0A9P6LAI7_9AGAM|nr:hypothetical protein BJ322DRAFT_1105684 [Thelephora terrestris]
MLAAQVEHSADAYKERGKGFPLPHHLLTSQMNPQPSNFYYQGNNGHHGGYGGNQRGLPVGGPPMYHGHIIVYNANYVFIQVDPQSNYPHGQPWGQAGYQQASMNTRALPSIQNTNPWPIGHHPQNAYLNPPSNPLPPAYRSSSEVGSTHWGSADLLALPAASDRAKSSRIESWIQHTHLGSMSSQPHHPASRRTKSITTNDGYYDYQGGGKGQEVSQSDYSGTSLDYGDGSESGVAPPCPYHTVCDTGTRKGDYDMREGMRSRAIEFDLQTSTFGIHLAKKTERGGPRETVYYPQEAHNRTSHQAPYYPEYNPGRSQGFAYQPAPITTYQPAPITTYLQVPPPYSNHNPTGHHHHHSHKHRHKTERTHERSRSRSPSVLPSPTDDPTRGRSPNGYNRSPEARGSVLVDPVRLNSSDTGSSVVTDEGYRGAQGQQVSYYAPSHTLSNPGPRGAYEAGGGFRQPASWNTGNFPQPQYYNPGPNYNVVHNQGGPAPMFYYNYGNYGYGYPYRQF